MASKSSVSRLVDNQFGLSSKTKENLTGVIEQQINAKCHERYTWNHAKAKLCKLLHLKILTGKVVNWNSFGTIDKRISHKVVLILSVVRNEPGRNYIL